MAENDARITVRLAATDREYLVMRAETDGCTVADALRTALRKARDTDVLDRRLSGIDQRLALIEAILADALTPAGTGG